MKPIDRFHAGIEYTMKQFQNRPNYGNLRRGPDAVLGDLTIMQFMYDLPKSHSSFLLAIYVDRMKGTVTLPGHLRNDERHCEPVVRKNPEAALYQLGLRFLDAGRHCWIELHGQDIHDQ